MCYEELNDWLKEITGNNRKYYVDIYDIPNEDVYSEFKKRFNEYLEDRGFKSEEDKKMIREYHYHLEAIEESEDEPTNWARIYYITDYFKDKGINLTIKEESKANNIFVSFNLAENDYDDTRAI